MAKANPKAYKAFMSKNEEMEIPVSTVKTVSVNFLGNNVIT